MSGAQSPRLPLRREKHYERSFDRGFAAMKRFLLSAVVATALSAASGASAADAIYGVWVRDGHPTDKLEFFDCGGKLCAKGVLPLPDGSPAPLILRQASKTGPNSWKGDLFNPEDGKTYTGKITYDSPTQLTLTGCLVAFLCQSETWARVSGPTKASEPKAGEGKGAKATAAEPAKPGAGQEAGKPAKPAKPSEPKSAAPAKPAPAKPAAKPAAE